VAGWRFELQTTLRIATKKDAIRREALPASKESARAALTTKLPNHCSQEYRLNQLAASSRALVFVS
jgi:hypothetical protein